MKSIDGSGTPGPARLPEESAFAQDWLARMKLSLLRGQFGVVYQPFVHVATGKVMGVEALARWIDPERGDVSPSEFIPIAEANGFIHEFTEWMIDRSIGEIAALSPGSQDFIVSVNVSPQVLARSSFSAFLNRYVPSSERARLVIEITDRDHLEEGEENAFQALVNGLMDQGFRFAIDDFGTGHLDLRRLVRCPAHILKTNVSLIRHPENGRRGNLVLSLVADIARELNMRVIAEGVENAEQWENVRMFGLEYAKGYYICAPLKAPELERWLGSVSSGATVLPGRGAASPERNRAGQSGGALGSRPILVIEDGDADWLARLREMSSHIFLKGKMESATRMLDHFDFLICVLSMEKVTTEHHAFLRHRKKSRPDLPVIVVTGEMDPPGLVQLVREGVNDFILGPRESGEALDRIVEHADAREAALRSAAASETMAHHLRDRMEWESYKESRTLASENRFGQLSIDNLRVSLTQGAGFGLLITIIEMMGHAHSREDGMRLLDPGLLQLALENANIASKHIRGLDTLVDLMKKEMPLRMVGSREFFRLIEDSLSGMSALYLRKGLKLNLPRMGGQREFSLELDPSYFQMALQELAVNAYKYSESNTDVDLVVTLRAGYLCLGVKNVVAQEPYGGVPEAMQELVSEPFCRLHPPVEEGIEFETFGLGIGLTAVKYIMHQHRGMLSVRDVRDHSLSTVRPAVLASICFPVEEERTSGRRRD